MIRMPNAACAWTANVLVPGTGLVLMGRLVTGAVLALVWAASVVGLLMTGLVWVSGADPTVTLAFAACAAVVFAAAQAMLYVRRRAAARHLAGPARDSLFKEALTAGLQGRLDDAEAACRRLLRLDPDDVEATIELAVLARRRGRSDKARRLLRRARYLDDDGRCEFVITRELAENAK